MNPVEAKVYETFAGIAQSIGYSPLHGKIIGALMIEGKALPLQELSRNIGYSPSMVSISLDLLEVLGVIKKVKKTADRKLYIELAGDLLECLKKAVVIRIEKSIGQSLKDFEEARKELEGGPPEERKRLLASITSLEKEIKRLDHYIQLLNKIQLP